MARAMHLLNRKKGGKRRLFSPPFSRFPPLPAGIYVKIDDTLTIDWQRKPCFDSRAHKTLISPPSTDQPPPCDTCLFSFCGTPAGARGSYFMVQYLEKRIQKPPGNKFRSTKNSCEQKISRHSIVSIWTAGQNVNRTNIALWITTERLWQSGVVLTMRVSTGKTFPCPNKVTGTSHSFLVPRTTPCWPYHLLVMHCLTILSIVYPLPQGQSRVPCPHWCQCLGRSKAACHEWKTGKRSPCPLLYSNTHPSLCSVLFIVILLTSSTSLIRCYS